MNEKSQLMGYLHKSGKSALQIFKLLKPFMSRSGVYKTIKRFKDTGSYLPKVCSNPPRSVRTTKLVNSIRGKLRRNPERSGRQLARELQVSQTTMQNILRKDLKCYPYKKTKRQLKMLTC